MAYYLVHGMGRGSDGDFAAARARGGRELRPHGPRRGGRARRLPGRPGRRTRAPSTCAAATRPAEILGDEGPPLTYFRAAMVVGAGSESYRTLRQLVEQAAGDDRPVLAEDPHPADRRRRRAWPTWPRRPDVAERSRAARSRSAAPTCSPTARCSTAWPSRWTGARGRSSRCRCSRPGSPRYWIGLVTPVDAGVAKPLIEGLSTETVVTDPSGAALFDIEPMGIDEALRSARSTRRRSRRAVPCSVATGCGAVW